MSKNRFFLIIIALIDQLVLFGQLAIAPLAASDLTPEEALRAVSAPERDRLDLVSLSPVVFEGVIMGRLAAYDDVATRRVADYLELYDNAGHLIGFGWFDRFGIERTAVDRGLLKDTIELEGVFVVLTDGDPI